jgi:hypothetical protein
MHAMVAVGLFGEPGIIKSSDGFPASSSAGRPLPATDFRSS